MQGRQGRHEVEWQGQQVFREDFLLPPKQPNPAGLVEFGANLLQQPIILDIAPNPTTLKPSQLFASPGIWLE